MTTSRRVERKIPAAAAPEPVKSVNPRIAAMNAARAAKKAAGATKPAKSAKNAPPTAKATATPQSKVKAAAAEAKAMEDLYRVEGQSADVVEDQGGQNDAPEVEVLTRRSRFADGGSTVLDLPDKYKKPGWDYEYKTIKINGMEVDDSDFATLHDAGWRAVSPKQMPGYCRPGYTGKTIDRQGMRLFTRPMSLTEEARAEDYSIAETQKFDKLMAASAVPTNRPGLINPFKTEMSIEGVVGTHKPAPKGATA